MAYLWTHLPTIKPFSNMQTAWPTLRALFFLALLPCWAAAQSADRMTPELLWKLGRVALEDVSPDGTMAVYGVTYFTLETNKSARDLYLVPVAGGTPKKLTAFEGSKENARFRPDGKRIGYLRNGLLWEMNPDGSDQLQVSDIEMGAFLYRPDGKGILYVRDIQYDKAVKDVYPDLPLATGRIIDGLMYRHWKSWQDGAYSNVFWAAYENGCLTGQPTNIMGEPFDSPLAPMGGVEQLAWSPDGKTIAYTCKKLSGTAAAVSTDSDIYLYDLSTGKTLNLTEGMDGYDMNPAFSPDGRFLAWNSMATPGYEADRNRIFLYDFSKKTKEELSVGQDREFEQPVWAKDGKTVYAVAGDRGTMQIFALDVATQKTARLTTGVYNYDAIAVAGTDFLVAARMSMSAPAELFRVRVKNGEAAALTNVNETKMAGIKLGEVRERTVRTTDGKDMLAWVIYPPDFDPGKKYPTLLYCQGGPQSAVSQSFSYRWNFQLMAANGYIVVAPNRRGTLTFGQQWTDAIAGDWGGQAIQDYLSAIDAVCQEPYVDAARLGAVGASYGGYSVYWLAGHHNKRFKTFIAHCGLFNLESWYGTTEEVFFANHDLEGAYWQKNTPESYLKFSPHRFVGNWDTPILVIHNELDFRVPIGEGIQAFQAAQLQGVPSRFLYFPDEGHWMSKPQNSVLWQRVFFEWLDKHLK